MSLAGTEESPDPSAGGDAISTIESTSEVDGSSDTTSSDATFLTHDSTSGETQNHWISDVGLDCNLQFQTVNHEPSTEQAASLLFGFRNSQPAPSFPTHRVSNAAIPSQFQPSVGSLINEAVCLPDPAATIAEDPSSQWQTQQFAGRTVQEETRSHVPSGQHDEIDDELTGDNQSSKSGSISMPTWTYQSYPNDFTMHEINMFPPLPPRQDLSQDILNEINMFPPLPLQQDPSHTVTYQGQY